MKCYENFLSQLQTTAWSWSRLQRLIKFQRRQEFFPWFGRHRFQLCNCWRNLRSLWLKPKGRKEFATVFPWKARTTSLKWRLWGPREDQTLLKVYKAFHIMQWASSLLKQPDLENRRSVYLRCMAEAHRCHLLRFVACVWETFLAPSETSEGVALFNRA